MKKIAFLDQFIITFCATWCAQNYTDYCMRGLQKELEKPPIEDAVYLARCAWKEYNKLNPSS